MPDGEPASSAASATLTPRAWALFLVLGCGTQWLTNDALNECLGIFMAELPGGLNLPQVASSLGSNIGSAIVLLLWQLLWALGWRPKYADYFRCNWVYVSLPAIVSLVAAIGWRAVIGETAVVVIGALTVSGVQGQFMYIAQMPMLALHFAEPSLAAVMTGGGFASLFAGILGLIQSAAPQAFGPSALLGIVFFVCVAAICAWYVILRDGTGRRRATVADAGAPADEKPTKPPQPSTASEASTLLAPAARVWDRYVCAVVGMGCVLSVQTWGLTFLQYATTKASCTCDTDDAAAQLVYQLAQALSYVAMPIGGALAHVAPWRSLRSHAALTALHSLAYAVQSLAVAGAGFMTCSVGAQALVILAQSIIRGVFQYLTALQYGMLAAHFESAPLAREAAVLWYGILASLGSAGFGLLSYALTEANVVSCDAAQFSLTSLAEGPGSVLSPQVSLPSAAGMAGLATVGHLLHSHHTVNRSIGWAY